MKFSKMFKAWGGDRFVIIDENYCKVYNKEGKIYCFSILNLGELGSDLKSPLFGIL